MRSIVIKSAAVIAAIGIAVASTAPASAKGFGFGHWGHWGHWGHHFGGFFPVYVGGGDDCYIKTYYDEDGYKHYYKVCD